MAVCKSKRSLVRRPVCLSWALAENFKVRQVGVVNRGMAMVMVYHGMRMEMELGWDWGSSQNTFPNHTPLSGHVRIKWLDLAGVLFICLWLCCLRRRLTESAGVEWTGLDIAYMAYRAVDPTGKWMVESGKFYGCSCQLLVYVILWPRLRFVRWRLSHCYCL